MIKHPRFLTAPLSLLSAILLPLLGVSPVFGESIYETGFDGPEGDLPEGWERLTDDPSIQTTGKALRLSRDGSPGTGVARTVALVGKDSSNWTDYVIEATFADPKPGINFQRNGVFARWSGDPEFPLRGYNAYLSGDQLVIARDLTRGVQPSEILASVKLNTDLTASTTYTLRFQLMGPKLRAELLDATGTSLAAAEADDASYSQGSPGLQAYFASGGRRVECQHFVVLPVSKN